MAIEGEARHLTEEQRAEYVDGRMAESARLAAERHLAGCPACRAAVEGEQAVARLLHRLPSLDPPRTFTLPRPAAHPARARAAGWMRLASGLAAACFVLLLGVDLLAPRSALAPATSPQRPLAAEVPATPAVPGPASRATPAAPRAAQGPADASAAASEADRPARAAQASKAKPLAASPAAPVAGREQAAPAASPAVEAKPAAEPPRMPAEAPGAAALPPTPGAAALPPRETAPSRAPEAAAGTGPAPLPTVSAARPDGAEASVRARGTPTPIPEPAAEPPGLPALRLLQGLSAGLALILGAGALLAGRRSSS